MGSRRNHPQLPRLGSSEPLTVQTRPPRWPPAKVISLSPPPHRNTYLDNQLKCAVPRTSLPKHSQPTQHSVFQAEKAWRSRRRCNCLSEPRKIQLRRVNGRDARRFAHTLSADRLPQWLTEVHNDDLPRLHNFAAGLQRDLAAVTAGLTLPWNSGTVEGHVDRIKMLKRQMFSRTGFQLWASPGCPDSLAQTRPAVMTTRNHVTNLGQSRNSRTEPDGEGAGHVPLPTVEQREQMVTGFPYNLVRGLRV